MKNLSTAGPHTSVISILITYLSFTTLTHALPSPANNNILTVDTAAQQNLTVANLTQLTCTPRTTGSSPTEFKPLNSTTCRYSLANFTNTYNQSNNNNSNNSHSPDTNLTLSASPAHVSKNPATTVLVPVEVAPPEEGDFPGGACSVVFAVYYGSQTKLPDVKASLGQLEQAAEKVIDACTGGTQGGNTGNGGGVVLTTPEGKIIDVTVQRPV